MKKLFAILFLILLIPSFSFAAIDAAMVWEVRAEGSQNYGGGFKAGASGTDYSQYDSCKRSWVAGSAGGCAQSSPTNTVNDLSCTNATPSVCTSATYNFAAADVGNIIHIISGTNATAGWYEIVSVADNAATLDRTCMTGEPSADITAYEGGAFLIGGTLDDDFFESKVAGNTIYVKNGAYVLGENISIGVNGTAALPIQLIGYITNRSTVPIGSDRPSFQIGLSINFVTGNYYKLLNIIAFRPAGSSGHGLTTGSGGFSAINCKFYNETATASQAALNIQGTTALKGCEAYSTNGYAISYLSNMLHAKGCYVHDSLVGLNGSAGVLILTDSILDTNTTAVVMTTPSSGFISNNTFYNASGPTGTGISATGPYNISILNNIFEGFSVPITLGTEEKINTYDYNAYYNNTSASNSNVTEGPSSINLDATAFTGTPADGDFRIDTNVKALGFPGSWVPMGAGATCVGYPDIGAVQRIEPAGGAGGGAWAF